MWVQSVMELGRDLQWSMRGISMRVLLCLTDMQLPPHCMSSWALHWASDCSAAQCRCSHLPQTEPGVLLMSPANGQVDDADDTCLQSPMCTALKVLAESDL